ncbi:MAG: hypothetical protein ABFS30_15695 [Pseudomonadota bacterium]
MNMKAAASLTGSLLARKGAAYPASYSAPTPSTDSPDGASDASAARAYNDPRVIASAPPAPVAPAAFSNPAQQPGEQLQDGRFAASPATSETPAKKRALDMTPSVDTVPSDDPAPMVDTTPAVDPTPTLATQPVADAGMGATDSVGLPQTMDKMGRVRLSVRLDPDRYLRVKMASARTRWSAQDIVIAALDRYLSGKPKSDSEDGENDNGGNHGNLN